MRKLAVGDRVKIVDFVCPEHLRGKVGTLVERVKGRYQFVVILDDFKLFRHNKSEFQRSELERVS